MKYKRLLIILSSVVAFAFAVLIFVALFSVKDVTVRYSVYGTRVEGVEQALSVYKGKNLLFISESDIEKTIKEKMTLKIDSVKKVYPSSIEVSVSSRQERFAIETGEGDYYVVDEEYAVVARRDGLENYADALENILVTFDVNEKPTVELNKYLDMSDPSIVALAAVAAGFDSPRDVIESILIVETAEKGNVRITVQTRIGVQIVIFKAYENADLKMQAAVAKLGTLSDGDKLVGKIECLMLADGSISAVYTTH